MTTPKRKRSKPKGEIWWAVMYDRSYKIVSVHRTEKDAVNKLLKDAGDIIRPVLVTEIKK